MDARECEIFYPRLAADLRQIEADATPGWVATRHGLRPTREVLPEATVATAVQAAVTVWLALGLICWSWAASWWSLAALTGAMLVGVGDIVRYATILARQWRGGRR